jgi:hypothetical protein
MVTHPAIHLDIARQRHQDALARAELYRLAKASHQSAMPQVRLVTRMAALVRSVLRRDVPRSPRALQDRPCEVDA